MAKINKAILIAILTILAIEITYGGQGIDDYAINIAIAAVAGVIGFRLGRGRRRTIIKGPATPPPLPKPRIWKPKGIK